MKPGEIAALLVGPAVALSLYLLLVTVVWDAPVAWTGVTGAIVAGLVGAAAGEPWSRPWCSAGSWE